MRVGTNGHDGTSSAGGECDERAWRRAGGGKRPACRLDAPMARSQAPALYTTHRRVSTTAAIRQHLAASPRARCACGGAQRPTCRVRLAVARGRRRHHRPWTVCPNPRGARERAPHGAPLGHCWYRLPNLPLRAGAAARIWWAATSQLLFPSSNLMPAGVITTSQPMVSRSGH